MGVPLLIISSLPAVRPIMLQRLSIHLWLLASLIAAAAAAPAQLLDKRQRVSVYAAGGCFESGSFSSDLKWQSSGVLTSLGARDRLAVGMRTGWKMELPDGTAGYQTTRCATVAKRSADWDAEQAAIADDENVEAYFEAFPEQRPVSWDALSMAGSTNLTTNSTTPNNGTDNGGGQEVVDLRQRIEIFTWPGAPENSSWIYSWKSHLEPNISTAYQFNHLWQILRRDEGPGPVVSLDAKDGKIAVDDFVAGCRYCVSVPIEEFWGRTIYHNMYVTYGPNGRIAYSAYAPENPRRPLLRYARSGEMGSAASLKTGIYRKVVPSMTAATGYVGQLSAVRTG